MDTLSQLLESIGSCHACSLMARNSRLGIRSIPVVSKPEAEFVFIGRDPSPRTAARVGVRGGRSVFINEIFAMADEAALPEEKIYITDMCKCHWRTSRGKPWKGTKTRSALLPKDIAECCVRTWLIKEIEILKPTLIFAFGEEPYQLLKPLVLEPRPVPEKLSATRDKSIIDAEIYFGKTGPLKIKFGSHVSDFIPLRHPGNSTSLARSMLSDKRWQAHQESRKRAIALLKVGCA